MAITQGTTPLRRFNPRGLKCTISILSSNENYASGGLALSADTLGLGKVHAAQVVSAVKLNGGTFAVEGAYVGNYDIVNNKVQLFWVDTTVDGAAMVEIPNATAIGLTVYTVIAYGQ